MTHLIILHEGFTDGFDRFKKNIESCTYDYFRPDKKKEITIQPKVREVRLLDVVVPESVKDKFLSDLMEISPAANMEQYSSSDGRHDGVKTGMIKKVLQTLCKIVGFKPIDLNKYKPSKEGQLKVNEQNNPEKYNKHGHTLPLAELPDGFNKNGKEML